MPPLPPPGTFRLYPYANPPLAAGAYTITGEVTGLPGTVESLQAALDVTAPRFALPPDQLLSTFRRRAPAARSPHGCRRWCCGAGRCPGSARRSPPTGGH